MNAVISAESFGSTLRIMALVCPIIGAGVWLTGSMRRSRDCYRAWSISIAVIPIIIYGLWLLEQFSISRFGLDSVLGLCIMVVIFCAVGFAAAMITTVSKRGK